MRNPHSVLCTTHTSIVQVSLAAVKLSAVLANAISGRGSVMHLNIRTTPIRSEVHMLAITYELLECSS